MLTNGLLAQTNIQHEHLFETYDYSVCVTESFDSNYHLVVLNNIKSRRADTIMNTLSGGYIPNRIAKFVFIDSLHYVIIIEKLYHPYPLEYYVIKMSSRGFEIYFSEEIILNNRIKRNSNNAYSRKGSAYYEVVNPTQIKILDRGKPVALLYFDLEQKKLIRTEINRE